MSEPHNSSQPGKSITVNGVSKIYQSRGGGEVEACRRIDLEIEAGEFVAIVGPSGCGKSTLLYMMAGFSAPTSGRILCGGVPVSGPDIERSMVFQNYALFPWLNVRGNVEFGLENKGVPRDVRTEKVDRHLKLVGLSEFADKHISELSGGMKQRVAIARAFAVEPGVILMDEPFGALDALTRRFLQRELLRIWREQACTVAFVTHSVPESIFLADRIVVMSARPGELKSMIDVDLPHPRDSTSDGFRDLERRIYADLDEELAKTFSAEGLLG
ncbi:MAG: ABC transporter ATP-binding protein [Alphaproteobacteria bacterium]|nr:ABC transporter ATP-binding protein [Alphaproteobacteria bacterium]